MTIRQATTDDIRQIQFVRNSVRENALSDPGLVTDEDCRVYLTERGRGWVGEVDGRVVGFAVADVVGHNIWALFVQPGFDRRGLGRALHDTLLDWYFGQTAETVWLGTAPGTRAEEFYRQAGWRTVGTHGKGEVKFELTRAEWANRSPAATFQP